MVSGQDTIRFKNGHNEHIFRQSLLKDYCVKWVYMSVLKSYRYGWTETNLTLESCEGRVVSKVNQTSNKQFTRGLTDLFNVAVHSNLSQQIHMKFTDHVHTLRKDEPFNDLIIFLLPAP